MKDSVEQDKARASAYGILGKLYDNPPSGEMLEELRDTRLIVLPLDRSAELYGDDLGCDTESLAIEFTRLFLGPGKHAWPFASVYRKDDRRSGELWGSTTAEVKRFIEYYGLSLRKPGAIPDHIAVLFEFMERMIRAKLRVNRDTSCDQTTREESLKVATSVERRFFSDYIDCWIDDFLDHVEQMRPAPFYARLIEYSRLFISGERGLFKRN